MSILVTGGAGFIGSNFVLDWLAQHDEQVITLDKLTYAGNRQNLAGLADDPRHIFIQGDIVDGPLIDSLLTTHRPRAIIHFAAESHVDRSILNPEAFITTNVQGTFQLLESTRRFWQHAKETFKHDFRFVHVSTDEVYGSLEKGEPAFTENHRYEPNSPYSASKASADHLVRAYNQTYGLPAITTHCSNNYGPYHFPEKLIPLIIHHALAGKPLPVYGDGKQIRDWLYVKDHCAALRCVLETGRVGETYNISGWNEQTNIDVIIKICFLLDNMRPRADGNPYAGQIHYIQDRPGHDRRYALDASKIESELGWRPVETFDTGIRKTVQWYLDNLSWVDNITTGAYVRWMEKQYR